MCLQMLSGAETPTEVCKLSVKVFDTCSLNGTVWFVSVVCPSGPAPLECCLCWLTASAGNWLNSLISSLSCCTVQMQSRGLCSRKWFWIWVITIRFRMWQDLASDDKKARLKQLHEEALKNASMPVVPVLYSALNLVPNYLASNRPFADFVHS